MGAQWSVGLTQTYSAHPICLSSVRPIPHIYPLISLTKQGPIPTIILSFFES